jgi:glycosyltransferase involved in cell wall biosynthesis
MQPSPTPSIAVVIPVHNEAGFLPTAIPLIFDELERVKSDVSVVLVENGSTDGTAEVAQNFAADLPMLEVMRLPTPDYGAAMRAGFLAAEADWVVLFDIDYFSGDFLNAVLDRPDADVVLASKRAAGADDRRSGFRRLATLVFNMLLRFLLQSGVSDTHGMKALRRDVVQVVAPRVISTKDLFDTELVIRAERAGYAITEVPATVEEMREARSSLIKRVPRTLRGLWTIRRLLADD